MMTGREGGRLLARPRDGTEKPQQAGRQTTKWRGWIAESRIPHSTQVGVARSMCKPTATGHAGYGWSSE